MPGPPPLRGRRCWPCRSPPGRCSGRSVRPAVGTWARAPSWPGRLGGWSSRWPALGSGSGGSWTGAAIRGCCGWRSTRPPRATSTSSPPPTRSTAGVRRRRGRRRPRPAGGTAGPLTMTYKPVPTVLARREVARARASLDAERHRKRAMGQLTSAEDGKRQDAAEQREQELADGHAVLVYAATVTVTADTLEALERASDHLRHIAAMAGCELQFLDGQQAQGFTWTLPLCRGVD